MKMNHDTASTSSNEDTNPMDKLLAKLSEQQEALSKQRELLKSSDDDTAYIRTAQYVSGANSLVPIASAMDSFNTSTVPTTNTPSLAGDDTPQPSAAEVLRLKLELEAAKGRIARMDQELAQSRITKHTLDQAIGTPSEVDFPMGQQNLKSAIRPQLQRDPSWAGQDDSRSDTSDALSASGFNRTRAIWGNGAKPSFAGGQAPTANFQPSEALTSSQWMNRGFGQPFIDAPMQYTGPPINTLRGDRLMPDPDLLMAPPANRRNNLGSHFTNRAAGSFSYAGSNGSYDGYTPTSTPYGSVTGMSGVGMGNAMGLSLSGGMSGMSSGASSVISGGMYSGYQPQPIGTPLSPHAPEFTSSTGWKGDVSVL